MGRKFVPLNKGKRDFLGGGALGYNPLSTSIRCSAKDKGSSSGKLEIHTVGAWKELTEKGVIPAL